MTHADQSPPPLLRRLIAASLPAEDEGWALDELQVLYRDRVRQRGITSARLWYARQAAAFVTLVPARRFLEFVFAPDGLRGEARSSARSLARQPAFVFAFTVTLAIAVGVISTVYASARWLLLRPVPGVVAPEDLVTLRLTMKGAPAHVAFDVSEPNLETLRARLAARGALAASTRIDVDVSGASLQSRRTGGEMVSANYFTVLGAHVAAGRAFTPGEDRDAAGAPSAIVSDALARSIAGSPQEAVGADLRVNGSLVRIVGVTERGFRGSELPERAHIWMPLSALPVIDPAAMPQAPSNPGAGVWRTLIARPPTPGVEGALASEANAVLAAIRSESGASSFMGPGFTFVASRGVGLDPGVRASVLRTLRLLGGASILLLLLAVANLANLSLVRATTTSTATAIRFALGASRARIARAVFMDAVILACIGGAGALMLAGLWGRWYQSLQLDEHGGRLAGMHVEWQIAAGAFAAALLAAVVAFLRPAIESRSGIERQLRQARNAGGSRLRLTLVAAQVAFSVLLLVGAGLMGRTVANLHDIDLGFEPDRILTMSMDPHLHGIERERLGVFARELERRAAGIPGVRAAGLISPAPLGSSYFTASVYPSAAAADAGGQPTVGAGYYVSAGFLAAVGARVIGGGRSWRGDSGTVVLTRAAASTLFPGKEPRAIVDRVVVVGRRKQPHRVAAVIEDLILSDITQEPPPALFLPIAQRIRGLSMMAFVATGGRPERAAGPMREAIRQLAPELPVFDVRSARDGVDQQFAARKALARAASTLGGVGLLLAAFGLYGVLSHLVAARRREFGVRAAMGATPGRLVREIGSGGFAPVILGLCLGLVGAVAIGRALRSQLYGVEPYDPGVYAIAIGTLVAAGLIACAFPARRASRAAPAEVLRDLSGPG